MRKIFRLSLRFGFLAFLVVVGLLTSMYLARVRLAQYAVGLVLENAELIEARASVDSITPNTLTLSEIVLVGKGWHFELDGLQSTYDVWSLTIHEIETGEGRLFVDLDRILETPSDRSIDELADLMESVQSALPEMKFSVNRIRAELVFMGRPIELTVSGEGSVSSVHQLVVSLEAACGDLSAEFALEGDRSGQVVEISGKGRVADLAQWVSGVTPSWRDFLPFDGPFDLDASSVSGDFHLGMSRLRPIAFQADAGVAGLDICFRDRAAWVDVVDLVAGWTSKEGAAFEAVLGGLALDDGEFDIAVPLGQVVGRTGESIVISSERAVIESERISGSIEFAATIPWPDAGRLPIGTVVEGSISRLITLDREWKPIDFVLGIDPGFARFRLPRLAVIEANWPVVSNLEGSVSFDEGNPDSLSFNATVDLAVDPPGLVSAKPESGFSVSGKFSGLAGTIVKGGVRIEPSGDRAVLALDGIGSFDTAGELNVRLEVSEYDLVSTEIGLKLDALEFAIDGVDGTIASFSLDLVVPPTPIAELARLSESSLLDLAGLASGLELKMELIGDRLSLPGAVVLEWFDLNLVQNPKKTGPVGGPDLQASFSAANLRVAGETLHTIEIVQDMTFAEREIRSSGHLKALFDGSLLTGQFDDRILFGEDGQPVEVRGRVAFEPFEIRYSDLVARHFSEVAGLSMGAIFNLSADGWWLEAQPWDVSLDFSVDDGSLTFPPKNFQVEGIEGGLQIASVRDWRVESEATWSFRRLTASDLAMDHGRMVFGFDGSDRLDIADLSFEAFEGKFRLDPFSYSIAERTADLRLHVTGLDVGVVLEQLDFYKGSFEGSIDGAIPFAIRKGGFVPQQGRLELTPGVPAFFHYPAEGLLTRGEVAKTMTDRIRLLPLQMAEKGLDNVQVETLTIDLFDPDYPSSPARIYIAGKALAEETEIPYFISTNVNGTVAEVLNFLFRLSSL